MDEKFKLASGLAVIIISSWTNDKKYGLVGSKVLDQRIIMLVTHAVNSIFLILISQIPSCMKLRKVS
jgi:hypothetical protein